MLNLNLVEVDITMRPQEERLNVCWCLRVDCEHKDLHEKIIIDALNKAQKKAEEDFSDCIKDVKAGDLDFTDTPSWVWLPNSKRVAKNKIESWQGQGKRRKPKDK